MMIIKNEYKSMSKVMRSFERIRKRRAGIQYEMEWIVKR